MKPWQNRIVGHDAVDPKTLTAHDRNWRVHTPEQTRALAGAIGDIGFIRSVTVNKRTGRIIDGHLRVALAIEQGQESIPVEYVDLSDAEEAEALATLDPLAELAGIDVGKLGELSGMFDSGSLELRDMLDRLLTGEAAQNEALIEPEGEEHEIPNMDLHPFEHYDYVVLLFKNDQDFQQAVEKLGIKKVEVRYGPKCRKVGLGRVVDGAEAMKRLCNA
jgi:hypothetical protein